MNEKEFLQELYNDLDTAPVKSVKELLITCEDARLKIKERLEALEELDTD